jgi:hypothetical protein
MAYKFSKQPHGCKDNIVWNTDSDKKNSTDNHDSLTSGSHTSSAFHTALFTNSYQMLILIVR